MQSHNDTDEMKKTAACLMRMAEATKNSTPDDKRHGRHVIYLGDSWFAIVDVVVELHK